MVLRNVGIGISDHKCQRRNPKVGRIQSGQLHQRWEEAILVTPLGYSGWQRLEERMQKMPATIVDGAGRSHNFETPSRCIDLGAGGMWGEFDVPDTSCAPKWGQIRKDACRGIGIRQYSAVLENIPAGMSWDEACKQTGAEITNDYGTVQRFDKPNELSLIHI